MRRQDVAAGFSLRRGGQVTVQIHLGVRERRHRLKKEAYLGEVVVAFTACVAGRRALFQEPGIVQDFVEVLRSSASRYASTVILFCFMPDQVHIVLRGVTPHSDVWRAMVTFKQRTGFWLKKHNSPIRWQKDFFDRVVRRDKDMMAELRYIALNPVRGGLVRDWYDYPFLGSDAFDLGDLFSAA
jgi:REP element-mobilizing transposase RayT